MQLLCPTIFPTADSSLFSSYTKLQNKWFFFLLELYTNTEQQEPC